MPASGTLPRSGEDWDGLTPQQRAAFRTVIEDAFGPDLMAPDRPFRPGLRVKGVKAHPDVFVLPPPRERSWTTTGS